MLKLMLKASWKPVVLEPYRQWAKWVEFWSEYTLEQEFPQDLLTENDIYAAFYLIPAIISNVAWDK